MQNEDKVFNSTEHTRTLLEQSCLNKSKSFHGLNFYLVFVSLVLLINSVIDRSKSCNEK